MDLPAANDKLIQHLHLSPADAGADVAHAVVVSRFGVLVVLRLVAGLRGEELCPQRLLLRSAHQRPAPRSGDDLVAVEGKAGQVAEAAALLPFVFRSQGLRGVFQHRDTVPAGDFRDPVNPGRHAVQVHWDDGLRLPAGFFNPVSYGFFEQRRVHVPGILLAFDKHRAGPEVFDRVGGCHEGERLADYLVAGPHPQQDKPQVDRRGA